MKDIHLIGISLAMTGVSLSMYLNQFFPEKPWTPMIMALAFVLTCSWKNMLRFRFPSENKLFILIICFQIFMLLYGVFSPNLTGQLLSFHLFIIALSYAMMSLPRSMVYDNLPIVLYLVSLLNLIFGFIVCFLGLVSSEEAFWLRRDDDNFAIEPFSVAIGTTTNMFAALCLFRKGIFLKLMGILSILIGFYILLDCDKRTPVLVFFAGLLYFLYVKKIISIPPRKKQLKWIILFFLILFISYTSIQEVQEKVDGFFYNVYAGIVNLFGFTSVSDTSGSAIMRYENREKMLTYIDHNFSIANYIVGEGYMTMWIDNPLLQAYCDMGIVGCLFYFLLIVVFPLSCFKFKHPREVHILSVVLTFYSILSIINSGHPYQYIKYTPLCLLALVYGFFLRKKNTNSKQHSF